MSQTLSLLQRCKKQSWDISPALNPTLMCCLPKASSTEDLKPRCHTQTHALFRLLWLLFGAQPPPPPPRPVTACHQWASIVKGWLYSPWEGGREEKCTCNQSPSLCSATNVCPVPSRPVPPSSTTVPFPPPPFTPPSLSAFPQAKLAQGDKRSPPPPSRQPPPVQCPRTTTPPLLQAVTHLAPRASLPPPPHLSIRKGKNGVQWGGGGGRKPHLNRRPLCFPSHNQLY